MKNYYQNQSNRITAAHAYALRAQEQIIIATSDELNEAGDISAEYDQIYDQAQALVDSLKNLLDALEPLVDAEKQS